MRVTAPKNGPSATKRRWSRPGNRKESGARASERRLESAAQVRVLVVDDESLFRNSVADAIESNCPDFVVLQAGHGQEALEHVGKGRIDVLVTDVQMPVMDGVELILALQKSRFRGQVIVVTAFGSPRLETKVRSHGAIAYLEKPIDLPELIDLIGKTAAGERSHIEGLTLSGITQLLQMERKTCLLRVSKGKMSGDLIFRDGELVDAVLGDLSGNEAALELLAWDEGLGLDLLAGVGLQATSVTEGLTHLILDAMRRRDEVGNKSNQVEVDAAINNGPKETMMGSVNEYLGEAMSIDGAIGLALVDHNTGMSLGQAGGGERLNLDVAGTGNTAVVRAKLRVIKDLGLDDNIEDILITLGTQYHLIRPLVTAPNLFLYMSLDREKTNLAMARHQLMSVEKGLTI